MQLLPRLGHATRIEVDALGSAQTDSQSHHIIEPDVDGVIGPSAQRKARDRRRKIDRQGNHDVFDIGTGIDVFIIERAGPRREHVLQQAVTEHYVKLNSAPAQHDLDLVLRGDLGHYDRTSGSVEFRFTRGIEFLGLQNIQTVVDPVLVHRPFAQLLE